MDSSDAELRRQSRSLFAVLRIIVRQGARSELLNAEYVRRLESRVGALARVQEMFLRAPTDGIDLEELIEGEMLAQAVPPSRRTVGGPDIRLGSHAALP